MCKVNDLFIFRKVKLMKIRYNKELDFYFFLLALHSEKTALKYLLKEFTIFEIHDLIAMEKRLKTLDYSALQNTELIEKLLLGFSEQFMALGYSKQHSSFNQCYLKNNYMYPALIDKLYNTILEVVKTVGESLEIADDIHQNRIAELHNNLIDLTKEAQEEVALLLKYVYLKRGIDNITFVRRVPRFIFQANNWMDL